MSQMEFDAYFNKKTTEDRCEMEEGMFKSDNSNLSRTNSLLNQRLRDDDIECLLANVREFM